MTGLIKDKIERGRERKGEGVEKTLKGRDRKRKSEHKKIRRGIIRYSIFYHIFSSRESLLFSHNHRYVFFNESKEKWKSKICYYYLD